MKEKKEEGEEKKGRGGEQRGGREGKLIEGEARQWEREM